MAGFDDLAVAPAAPAALERLRVATGGVDGPMERHCLRARQIAAEVRSQLKPGGEVERERPLTMPQIFWHS